MIGHFIIQQKTIKVAHILTWNNLHPTVLEGRSHGSVELKLLRSLVQKKKHHNAKQAYFVNSIVTRLTIFSLFVKLCLPGC
jgi:hypothetical protein